MGFLPAHDKYSASYFSSAALWSYTTFCLLPREPLKSDCSPFLRTAAAALRYPNFFFSSSTCRQGHPLILHLCHYCLFVFCFCLEYFCRCFSFVYLVFYGFWTINHSWERLPTLRLYRSLFVFSSGTSRTSLGHQTFDSVIVCINVFLMYFFLHL